MQCGHTLSQAQCRKTFDAIAALADKISYWKRVIHGMGTYDSEQESSYISYVAWVHSAVFDCHINGTVWYDMAQSAALFFIACAYYVILDAHGMIWYYMTQYVSIWPIVDSVFIA